MTVGQTGVQTGAEDTRLVAWEGICDGHNQGHHVGNAILLPDNTRKGGTMYDYDMVSALVGLRIDAHW